MDFIFQGKWEILWHNWVCNLIIIAKDWYFSLGVANGNSGIALAYSLNFGSRSSFDADENLFFRLIVLPWKLDYKNPLQAIPKAESEGK